MYLYKYISSPIHTNLFLHVSIFVRIHFYINIYLNRNLHAYEFVIVYLCRHVSIGLYLNVRKGTDLNMYVGLCAYLLLTHPSLLLTHPSLYVFMNVSKLVRIGTNM